MATEQVKSLRAASLWMLAAEPDVDPARVPEALGRPSAVLADDEARARTVAEARAHVLRFGWSEVARRTAALYRSLVGAASFTT